jgi:hypothetical protein
MEPVKLLTEDLGKIAEKAVCILADTPFDGAFKYSHSDVDTLVERLRPCQALFAEMVHTGRRSNIHDFEAPSGAALSVKTVKNKGQWKICPQILGQTTRKRFAHARGTTEEVADIKRHICESTADLLAAYEETTFHCPVLFYAKADNRVMFIERAAPIPWSTAALTFSHVEKGNEWKESTTLKVNGTSVGEFQIHTHRDAVKFRFNLKGLLQVFPASFNVQEF